MKLNGSQLPPEFFQEPQSSDRINIDYRRVLNKALQYWYLVVLCVLTAFVIAFLKNRYATRIFPVTASIIVKEADDISGAELLYNNPLLNFKRNYLNEPYIIKSYPLIQAVIEELNFEIAFYREGNILTTEIYDDFPIKVIPARNLDLRESRFDFLVLNEEEYQLTFVADENDLVTKKFRFGDIIQFNKFQGTFVFEDVSMLDEILNLNLIFTYTPSLKLASQYISRLNAEWAEEGAGVVNLSLTGSNPNKEMDFLAGLINRYQDFDLQNKNQTASRTVQFISGQLEGISDSLRNVERQLERFKDKNIVTDLGGEALRLYQKVEELESQKAQLIVSRNYYKYLIDYIQRNEDLHQIILPSSVGITDPILTNLVSRMNDMQLDIKMSGKEENPLIVEAVKRINEMKKDIIESVRNQESTDKIKFDFLTKQITEIEKQLGHLPTAERTLVSIQRNYALLENLYIFLLQKRSEAAISQASNTSDILVVNPPFAGEATSPKVMINYVIALILGFSVPLLGFVGSELLNNKIQSKEDIEKVTTIPFIGGVGHKTGENNIAVFNQPKSALAESFRALRSNLNYFVGQKEKAVFLITSSISGEGKTFTTVNLASVLSLSGKKTLIVGADMRRPKLYDDFGLKNETGLSTYLAGLAGFDEVRQKTPFENLELISGGPVPPNPSELLLTSRMTEFLSQAKNNFDYIIIDTPPLAIVTDAFVLTDYADHSIFVVRQGYTPKNLLKTAEDFYSTQKLKDISIVLNDIHKSGPGYGYGYGYGYNYSYGYTKNGNDDSYYN